MTPDELRNYADDIKHGLVLNQACVMDALNEAADEVERLATELNLCRDVIDAAESIDSAIRNSVGIEPGSRWDNLAIALFAFQEKRHEKGST